MSLAVKSYTRWNQSGVVSGIMYGLKPVTLSLVMTALIASLGMTVFTAQIPFEYWLGLAEKNMEGIFAVRWEMIPVFIFSTYVLWKKKLSILQMVILSALYGALAAWILGYR